MALNFKDIDSEFTRITDALNSKSDALDYFINRCEAYDLTKHTDKTQAEVISDKDVAKTFSVAIKQDILSAKNLNDIAGITTTPSKKLIFAQPLSLNKPEHYIQWPYRF